MFKRIKKICDQKNISISVLAKSTNISPSLFTELKSGRTKTISSKKLNSIAAFLCVSVDYLMGNTDDPTPPSAKKGPSEDDPKERELLTAFRRLNEFGKNKAIENIEDISAINKYTEPLVLIRSAARGGDYQEKWVTQAEADRIQEKINQLPDADNF